MKNTREKIIASAVLLALATGCVQNYKMSKDNQKNRKENKNKKRLIKLKKNVKNQ